MWYATNLLRLTKECVVCNKPVKVNQRAVRCDYCDRWHHARCCEINNAVYDALANSSCISRTSLVLFLIPPARCRPETFSRLLTTMVLINPPLLTAQMPKLRLALDLLCRCPALLIRSQIRDQGTSRGRQVRNETPLHMIFTNQAPPMIVITTSQALAHPSLILAIQTN